MKLLWIWLGILLVAPVVLAAGEEAFAANKPSMKREGGELGNSFIPFDSKIGEYSLEYNKKWRFNDLSQMASFTDAEATSQAASFLSVSATRSGGPQTMGELQDLVAAKHPGLTFTKVSKFGLSGIVGDQNGTSMIYLLRSPGDMISLRFRSVDGERTDKVIAHMLESFRVE